jgi:hypothetical protein
MMLPSPLAALTEVRAAVTADPAGRLLAPAAGSGALGDRHARSTVAAIAGLTSAARGVGLHRLELLLVRGGGSATVTAVRAQGFLLVAVDPARPTGPVERALTGWTLPAGPAPTLPPAPASTACPPPLPAQPAAPGASSAFSGSLAGLALPELIEFLRSARRTGVLECSGAAGAGWLRFDDGFLTGGAAPTTPGLADLLVRARRLSPLALRALELPSQGDGADRDAGARLVREGLVDEAAVCQALQERVALAVRELLEWKEGRFSFTSGAGPARTGPSARVDAQALLLQVFKELDESSRPAAAGEEVAR